MLNLFARTPESSSLQAHCAKAEDEHAQDDYFTSDIGVLTLNLNSENVQGKILKHLDNLESLNSEHIPEHTKN